MTPKEQLIIQLQTQAEQLNELQRKIFEAKIVLESSEKALDYARTECTKEVLAMANDEVMKKELSNETKRQMKVQELLSQRNQEQIDQVEQQQVQLKQLSQQFELQERTFTVTKLVARLFAKED